MNISKEELLKEYTSLVEAGEEFIRKREALGEKISDMTREEEKELIEDDMFKDILSRAEIAINKMSQ